MLGLMSRSRPDDRFDHLIRAATGVFIRQGYRRTQMSDVAQAAGLAKGTLYLYVDGKAALFDLALRYAAHPEPIPTPKILPVPAPSPGSTVRFVQDRLAETHLPRLAAAFADTEATDPAVELEGIVRELYAAMEAERIGIKLLDRCGNEFPEIAAAFRRLSREGLPLQLREYLRERIRREEFRTFPDLDVAARVVMELITTWAVHIHWDPSPVQYDPRAAEDTVVAFVKGALLRE